MTETFAKILASGGQTNSLGRSDEVVQEVLQDQSRLEELYTCLFEEDAWIRMRAADSLEKVCRVHPEWLASYVERFFQEVAKSNQPSLQWHLAQMFAEIQLSTKQKQKATKWLVEKLHDQAVDWIVAANTMETLTKFVEDGAFAKEKLVPLLKAQQKHHSKAVVKRAERLLNQLEGR